MKRIALFVRKVQTLKNSARLAYLKSHLDIPQYLRWLAGAVCTGNYDGFDQNYALYRTSGSIKYHISPWDYEGTWGRDCYGEIVSSRSLRIEGYNGLTERLLSCPSIRRKYRKVLQGVLQKHFTREALEPKIRTLYAQLLPELMGDGTRRHSAYDMMSDLHVFLRYIGERRAFIEEELSKL
ncbi:CotH kinase family protein [Paenibacillus filicis]|uniref:CotH kinase family protein n=1 Tax=Paenibacillus filicis TaxID=669464 RepID=A0ABU9DH97_9BACL